jgi:hypothetical protein
MMREAIAIDGLQRTFCLVIQSHFDYFSIVPGTQCIQKHIGMFQPARRGANGANHLERVGPQLVTKQADRATRRQYR